MEKFLKYVAGLSFDAGPNYAHCREIFRKVLPSSPKGSLFLDDVCAGTPAKSKKTSKKRPSPDAPADAALSTPKKFCVPESDEDSPPRFV